MTPSHVLIPSIQRILVMISVWIIILDFFLFESDSKGNLRQGAKKANKSELREKGKIYGARKKKKKEKSMVP